MAVLFDLANRAISAATNTRDPSETFPNPRLPENTLDEIIGLPPGYGDSMAPDAPNMNDVVRDSFPILEIIPAMPELKIGLEMFYLKEAMTTKPSSDSLSYYEELKQYYNYNLNPNTISNNRLKFAIQSNSFPVMESFANDYGESMFQGITDIASQALNQFRFMAGAGNVQDALGKIKGAASSMGLDKVSGAISAGEKGLSSILNKGTEATGGNVDFNQAASTIGNVLLGNKIDFPQVWKYSSWTPSYTANIRLYNPYPASKDATKRFIIGPLAALLMFVVPRSSDGYTFSWPWLCKYRVPGLYNIQSGFIRDVTVIRGGDDNHFALNSVPGIIDVRLTLGTLYSNMIGGDPENLNTRSNPTLLHYLDEMTGEADQFRSGPKDWSNGTDGYINDELSTKDSGPEWKQQGYPNVLTNLQSLASSTVGVTKVAQAASQEASENIQDRNEIPDRITSYQQNVYNQLKSQG